jgi:hypothetical protein
MSTVQQRRIKAIFFSVVRVVAGIKSLFIGISLFSLVRLRRFAVMERYLLGIPRWTRNKNLRSGRGSLTLTQVAARAETTLASASQRLVVEDPCNPS